MNDDIKTSPSTEEDDEDYVEKLVARITAKLPDDELNITSMPITYPIDSNVVATDITLELEDLKLDESNIYPDYVMALGLLRG